MLNRATTQIFALMVDSMVSAQVDEIVIGKVVANAVDSLVKLSVSRAESRLYSDGERMKDRLLRRESEPSYNGYKV